MSDFPRTVVGGLSVSRMIIGTNWFLGWSHCTKAKDNYIKQNVADRRKIADILEVFLRHGVDTIMGVSEYPPLPDAIRDAEDRTGRKAIMVATPHFPTSVRTLTEGFDRDECEKILDVQVKYGAAFCMPHSCTTDIMVDGVTREIRQFPGLMKMIREREMIPGLSTHLPQSIVIADESGLDVETYISLYNAMGFMMPVEVDWTTSIIRKAKKPVMCIKPMAAGQIRPLQALTFVWNTIRPHDMVVAGTMSPDEAAEVIEMSLAILQHRHPDLVLQETRSKSTVKAQAR